MRLARLSGPLCCIAAVVLLTGCAHTLEVKNLSLYRATQIESPAKRLAVGITSSTPDIAASRLAQGAGMELARYENVIFPYRSDRSVDVIVDIAVAAKYAGSGANFWINWPGFLVWAPAWHGYVYKVNYDTTVTLTKPNGGTPVDSFQIPIYLDVRHADINRTWTEISWLEFSAIAFVGGIVFTGYDDGVTPLLIEKIEQPVGAYIAQEILKHLRTLPQVEVTPPPTPSPPAAPEAAPP